MADDDHAVPFRDAEAWLAERGVRREPLRVRTAAPAPAEEPAEPGAPPERPATDATADVRAREAARAAAQSAQDAQLARAEREAEPRADRHGLEDDVAAAVAFVRRSTARTPQAEARVRAKLEQRGHPGTVVANALDRARGEGLVDDDAFACALVEEGRVKGHAAARIREDLLRRGLERTTVEAALAPLEAQDPAAVAFEVATRRARTLSSVDAETAFRRVSAYVARRGYPDALARKVARDAVFALREQEQTAGH